MNPLDQWREEITSNLTETLKKHLPAHCAREIYHYALLPPGKLFRPLLARSITTDLNQPLKEDHRHFELFIEIHHVYTLLHDDLPSMDNDSMRRGRTSSHCQYGEWQALLTGDGLHTLSYRILSLINSPELCHLLRYSTWALGPKGLIHGQYLDLSGEINQSFEKLVKTHRLKTARLFQVSLVGAAMIARAPQKILKDLHRLGEHLGISFQLLDDLLDRKETLSPLKLYKNEYTKELLRRLDEMTKLLRKHHLSWTQKIIKNYLEKTTTILSRDDSLSELVQKILKRLSL